MNKQNNPAWILAGALIVFVPLIWMALQGGWSPKLIPATPAKAQSYQVTVADSSYNVRVAPTISRAKVEYILCSSPHGNFNCTQLADTIYEDGVQYTIDPAFILAIFEEESNFGSTGMARDTKDVANIICIEPASWNAGIAFTCEDGFTVTRTWEDSVALYCRLLDGNIYKGKDTVKTIIEKATPSSNNPTNRYIDDVDHNMQVWATN